MKDEKEKPKAIAIVKHHGNFHTCSIYEVRPHGCRMYPVETDAGRQGVDCPGLVIPE